MARPRALLIEHRFASPSPEAEELLARAMELVLARARRLEQEATETTVNRELGATSPREKPLCP